MANAEPRTSVVTTTVGHAPVAAPPLPAYRGALARLELAQLRPIALALGLSEPDARSANLLAGRIAEHLENPRLVESVLGRLEHGPRLTLCLFALTEATTWPMAGLSQALECLGIKPQPTVRVLADIGVLAVAPTEPRRPSAANRGVT